MKSGNYYFQKTFMFTKLMYNKRFQPCYSHIRTHTHIIRVHTFVLIGHLFFSRRLQVVAERVHVRVFHRPDQTAAEHHVLRQRLVADRLGRRRRGHHRKVHAAGATHLHDRKVGADDPDIDSKRFQVNII